MRSHLAEILDLNLFKRKTIKGLSVTADIFSMVPESRLADEEHIFSFQKDGHPGKLSKK